MATPRLIMNVSEVQHIYPVYFIVLPPIKTNAFEVIDWPHVWLWNPGFIQRTRNPANVWNLGSKFHLQEIHNPESTAWNQETRIGFLSCGNHYWFAFVLCCWHCSVSFQSSFGGCTCSQHQETELKPVLNYFLFIIFVYFISFANIIREIHEGNQTK